MIASPVMLIYANSGTFFIALPLIYLILTATGSVSIISDSREAMSAFAGCLSVCVPTPWQKPYSCYCRCTACLSIHSQYCVYLNEANQNSSARVGFCHNYCF